MGARDREGPLPPEGLRRGAAQHPGRPPSSGTTESWEALVRLSLRRRAESLPGQNEGPSWGPGARAGAGGLSWRGRAGPALGAVTLLFSEARAGQGLSGRQAVSTPASDASGLLTALERGPLSFVCAPHSTVRSSSGAGAAPLSGVAYPRLSGGWKVCPLGVPRTPGTAAPGEIPSGPAV